MVVVLTWITAGALGILFLYWGVVLIKIIGYKPSQNSTEKPVSIIVCAHNELKNLKNLVPLLATQRYPSYEIIIVDDRSDDGTYDYLLENQSDKLRFVRVDQVHDHINPKKYALTLGIKAASHDMLLLTDADCLPASENWIQAMASGFKDHITYVLGISLYDKSPGVLGHLIGFETLWTAIHYIGFSLAGNPYMGVGRNLAYRKSAFIEHKGFGGVQHITGGDDDLLINRYANKHNTQVVLGSDSMTYSIPKTTWKTYIHQKIRHWSVGKHYRWKDKFLLGLQSLANIVFWLALTILATQTNDYLIPFGMLIFRMVFVSILFHITSKKFGERMNIWLVPFMDILYSGYASIVGFIALLTKKVRWKK